MKKLKVNKVKRIDETKPKLTPEDGIQETQFS